LLRISSRSEKKGKNQRKEKKEAFARLGRGNMRRELEASRIKGSSSSLVEGEKDKQRKVSKKRAKRKGSESPRIRRSSEAT